MTVFRGDDQPRSEVSRRVEAKDGADLVRDETLEGKPLPRVLNRSEIWRINQQLEEASFVGLTSYRARHGEVVEVLDEIVKMNEGVSLPAEIDGEVRAGEVGKLGDGQIVYFSGNPPQFAFGVSIVNGRIPMFGGMTLDEFREQMAARAKGAE